MDMNWSYLFIVLHMKNLVSQIQIFCNLLYSKLSFGPFHSPIACGMRVSMETDQYLYPIADTV